MCDEVNLWRSIPEYFTALKSYTWRELNELAFTSGSSYISFADGVCPEEFYHDGDNTTIDLKNIGAKKSLTISDILHSVAVAGANWNGINSLMGPFAGSQDMPGGSSGASSLGSTIANLKEKEMELAAILTLNGWDRLLALGNAGSNALEFSGIETLVTGPNGARANSSSSSGTFSANSYDAYLAEGCAKPQVIFGHSQAIQAMLSSYFQLGFAGSQLVNFPNGNRITPGFNFAGEVNTGVGTLRVVADNRFTKTSSGSPTVPSFQSKLYALRMEQNGLPLVFRQTQIPLAFKDLMPGCTAISFQIWAKTALIIKAMCAQSTYQSLFLASSVTSCPTIG
jgi:hypothetical protein